MSGITPLLDTLLPQVLGKRVDTPPPRVLNQPVQPASGAGAPSQVHSDSRLNTITKSLQLPLSEGIFKFQPASQSVRGAAVQPPFLSVDTNLSPAARTISTLLSQTSPQPSVIHQSQPLLADNAALSPVPLSSKLQASIRDSGLFYESHLAHWYRGSMPRQQLEREPQMRLFLAASQGGQGGDGDDGEEGLTKPAQDQSQGTQKSGVLTMLGKISALARGALLPVPVDAGVTEPHQVDGRETLPKGLRGQVAPREGLQGIVSQQLELLSTPLLHWEGEVWSGVFMALLIQIPEMVANRHGGAGGNTSSGDDEDDGSWSSELALDLNNLGLLKMKITLKDKLLTLWFQVPTDEVLSELDGQREALLARLQACGFDSAGFYLQVAEGE